MQAAETYFIGPGNQLEGGARRGHWCAVANEDGDGPRALSVPIDEYDLIRKGVMTDGMSGIDEQGKGYIYSGDHDLWVSDRIPQPPRLGQVDYDEFGGCVEPPRLGQVNYDEFGYGTTDLMTYPFSGRRERRKARRKRVRAKARKFFRRIGKGFRKVLAKIMDSKWVQNIVAGVLQSVGMPTRLTKAVIAAGGSIIRQGGVSGFIRLLRKDKKAALRMIAQAAKMGLKGAGIDAEAYKRRAKKRISDRTGGFRGVDEFGGPEVMLTGMGALYDFDAAGDQIGTHYQLRQQNGRGGPMSGQFAAAPVVAIVAAPGLGQVAELDITDTPTPGSWYQIDPSVSKHLAGTAKAAYGTTGQENYQRQKWLNQVRANAYAFDPDAVDNLHKQGKLSFMPRFHKDPLKAIEGVPGKHWATIYIPRFEGDEPPVTGKTGQTGKTGEGGKVGPAGPAGPAGPPGPPGPGGDGSLGPAGPAGPAGPRGLIGPAGPGGGGEGTVGPRGLIGPAGPEGATGPQGPSGEGGTGGGPMGPQGPAGPDGAIGPQGAAGAQGDPGDLGPGGEQGPIGPEGSVGPMGPSGKAGEGGGGGGGTEWPVFAVIAGAAILGGYFTGRAGR